MSDRAILHQAGLDMKRRYLDLSDPASVERVAAALRRVDLVEAGAWGYDALATEIIAALREPLP